MKPKPKDHKHLWCLMLVVMSLIIYALMILTGCATTDPLIDVEPPEEPPEDWPVYKGEFLTTWIVPTNRLIIPAGKYVGHYHANLSVRTQAVLFLDICNTINTLDEAHKDTLDYPHLRDGKLYLLDPTCPICAGLWATNNAERAVPK